MQQDVIEEITKARVHLVRASRRLARRSKYSITIRCYTRLARALVRHALTLLKAEKEGESEEETLSDETPLDDHSYHEDPNY